ncbi:hypothetical protein [Acidocella sp.]|uniref:hypothetical protein n=1 Tax=Acidocella sp. TaxID=50710 RepID=UPI00261EE307|nr:hypothetical protein [Acidocella sp.]
MRELALALALVVAAQLPALAAVPAERNTRKEARWAPQQRVLRRFGPVDSE